MLCLKIGKPMLANVPEDRTLAERCITTDGLLVPNPFYNNYFRDRAGARLTWRSSPR